MITNDQELIAKETALIAELNATAPELDRSVRLYHSNNTPWHQHMTKIRDAHWRRRIAMTRATGGDVNAAARVG